MTSNLSPNTTPNLPQPNQIYRHYKSTGGNNHLYQIVEIAKHTETEELMVVYKPLYQSDWFREATMATRPLEMFLEDVEYNGQKMPRFELENSSSDNLEIKIESQILAQKHYEFVLERGMQNNNPSDIIKSIVIEAGELLETIQWGDVTLTELQANPKKLQEVKEELADVFIYSLSLMRLLDENLTSLFEMKMAKNAIKYPVKSE